MEWTYWDLASDERRAVRFTPAFHRCTDPKGNFGIGSVTMMWMLRVGDAAIGWDVHTDWGLPDAEFDAASPGCNHGSHQRGYPHMRGGATGGAVDFHMPEPRWEGQEPRDGCAFIDGPCYMDSGFILGDRVFDVLRTQGDEATWAELRRLLEEYRSDAAAEVASR